MILVFLLLIDLSVHCTSAYTHAQTRLKVSFLLNTSSALPFGYLSRGYVPHLVHGEDLRSRATPKEDPKHPCASSSRDSIPDTYCHTEPDQGLWHRSPSSSTSLCISLKQRTIPCERQNLQEDRKGVCHRPISRRQWDEGGCIGSRRPICECLLLNQSEEAVPNGP